MRYILLFWALPMSLFWGWYFLSLNDINFGMLFFSRQLHDMVFEIYGGILGIAPEALPPMVARACILDTGIIFSIFAFRRRREIKAWVQATRQRYSAARSAPSA